jgi:hypothetical protein
MGEMEGKGYTARYGSCQTARVMRLRRESGDGSCKSMFFFLALLSFELNTLVLRACQSGKYVFIKAAAAKSARGCMGRCEKPQRILAHLKARSYFNW